MSSLPRLFPSSLNWTPATPTSSEALAVTLREPDTVAPSAGALTKTDGGVESAVAVALASSDGGPSCRPGLRP